MRKIINIGNKRIKETLTLFFVLAVALVLLIVPLYKITYDAIRNKVYGEIEYQAGQMADLIDSEIMMCHKIKMDFRNDPTYSMLKNMQNFDTSSQHIILKNFADDFSGKANMMPLNNYFYIFFNNNNVAVDKKNIFDNIEPIFDKYINIDNMDYKTFHASIFRTDLKTSVKYIDNIKLDEERKPSVVIFYPIDLHIGRPPETVIMTVYEMESLFGKIGMGNYRDIFSSISINDDVIYSDNKAADDRQPVTAMCKNIDLTISLKISEDYFSAYMSGFRRFICIYIIMVLLLIVAIEFAIDRYAKRPMRNVVRLVSGIVGDSSIHSEEDMYRAIGKLKKDKKSSDKAFLLTLFLKPLDSAEKEFIKSRHLDFPEPFIMVLFYGENINRKILELLMEKFGISWNEILSPRSGEYTVIFDCSDNLDTSELRTKLDDMMFSVKSQGVKLVAIMGIPCSSMEEFYYMYIRLKEHYRLVDYDGLFRLNEDNAADFADAGQNMIKSDKLYEYLSCGQAFEAQKTVYEQWYNVMISPGVTNQEIEKLFYSQMGVISEVAFKVRYKGKLAQYSPKIKVNDLAFLIANDIELICDLINSRTAANDKYDSVIKFIDEKFSNISFGMPDVEDRFGITGKTVNKIVRSKTGKTFTEYLEERRLNMAKELLLHSDDELKVISEKCGFQNYDTFYKFFKKHMGVSPVKWRKTKIIESSIDDNEI